MHFNTNKNKLGLIIFVNALTWSELPLHAIASFFPILVHVWAVLTSHQPNWNATGLVLRLLRAFTHWAPEKAVGIFKKKKTWCMSPPGCQEQTLRIKAALSSLSSLSSHLEISVLLQSKPQLHKHPLLAWSHLRVAVDISEWASVADRQKYFGGIASEEFYFPPVLCVPQWQWQMNLI